MRANTTLICTGSDGAGYQFDGARVCSACGVAFEDVTRTPIHFVREAEGIDRETYEAWR